MRNRIDFSLPSHFFMVIGVCLVSGCTNLRSKQHESEPSGKWQSVTERTLDQKILGSSSRRVGHGYREVRESVATDSNRFESVAHYANLYHQDQLLGDAWNYSISKSGRFAVYHRKNAIELFDRNRRAVAFIAERGRNPARFEWSLDETELTVTSPTRSPDPLALTVSTCTGERLN